jgi:antitoxin component HigA of HigAB toxin-antitoxin module
MANVTDPKQLHSESEYRAAVGEMRDLILSDPETPAGRRFDDLLRLIEAFEDAYGLAPPLHVAPSARTKALPTLRVV